MCIYIYISLSLSLFPALLFCCQGSNAALLSNMSNMSELSGRREVRKGRSAPTGSERAQCRPKAQPLKNEKKKGGREKIEQPCYGCGNSSVHSQDYSVEHQTSSQRSFFVARDQMLCFCPIWATCQSSRAGGRYGRGALLLQGASAHSADLRPNPQSTCQVVL